MCTITLSLAKRGEAIPGPYSSLTCFAGVRPGAVPERGEIEGHRHRRARWTFHSGQRRRHAHELRPCRRHSGEARDRLWRSGSRPPISSTHGPLPLCVLCGVGPHQVTKCHISQCPSVRMLHPSNHIAHALSLTRNTTPQTYRKATRCQPKVCAKSRPDGVSTVVAR